MASPAPMQSAFPRGSLPSQSRLTSSRGAPPSRLCQVSVFGAVCRARGRHGFPVSPAITRELLLPSPSPPRERHSLPRPHSRSSWVLGCWDGSREPISAPSRAGSHPDKLSVETSHGHREGWRGQGFCLEERGSSFWKCQCLLNREGHPGLRGNIQSVGKF